MNKILLLSLLLASTLYAKLNVTVTYPYIKEIVKVIAKDRVNVTALAKGNWDPHFVVPKPSLVAYLRESDLLIINGASLESAWLDPLVRSANNPTIQLNAQGFLDLSGYIKLQDIPINASRALGDIHVEGNPHYILDPHNVAKLAKVIMLKLSQLDPGNQSFYQQNFSKFQSHWSNKVEGYDAKMKKCRGLNVVQYHPLYNYFFRRYNINSIGTIEPLPGITPNPKHTLKLISDIKDQNVKYILQDVYHEHKTSQYLADKTNIEVIKFPHDIGAMSGTETLDGFYDTLVKSLCK